MNPSSPITLSLSTDHALILLDWLNRLHQRENPDLVMDAAELRVLWDLESMLEREVSETFLPDYPTLLAAARARVRDAD